MFSQNGFYILLSGVVLSIISGTLLLINTSNNNKFQLEREKQQRIWEEKNDQKKWYREKIYDCYRTSIEVFKKIIQARLEMKISDQTFINHQYRLEYPQIYNLYLEFNSEFDIIVIGYPDRDSEQFRQKVSLIKGHIEINPSLSQLLITEMMEDDSRIKSVN